MNKIVLELKILMNKIRYKFNRNFGRTKLDDDGYVQ